jgi:hypothetical protein
VGFVASQLVVVLAWTMVMLQMSKVVAFLRDVACIWCIIHQGGRVLDMTRVLPGISMQLVFRQILNHVTVTVTVKKVGSG